MSLASRPDAPPRHRHSSARRPALTPRAAAWSFTCLVVVHPVEHYLRRAVPACGHVARHLLIGLARQTEVQDLKQTPGLQHQPGPAPRRPAPSPGLTLSSQSSFTATLLGFRSCRAQGCERRRGAAGPAGRPTLARPRPQPRLRTYPVDDPGRVDVLRRGWGRGASGSRPRAKPRPRAAPTFSPRSSWYTRNWTCSSVSAWHLTMLFRSAPIRVVTRYLGAGGQRGAASGPSPPPFPRPRSAAAYTSLKSSMEAAGVKTSSSPMTWRGGASAPRRGAGPPTRPARGAGSRSRASGV